MPEINDYLKTQAPESTSLKRFLGFNFQEDTVNALSASIINGNEDIIVDLLNLKSGIQPQDTKDINMRKFTGSVSGEIINNGAYAVSDLPGHLQDAVHVVGASLGLCEYGNEEQKTKMFNHLDRHHEQTARENEMNMQKLRDSGELAPAMHMTPDL